MNIMGLFKSKKKKAKKEVMEMIEKLDVKGIKNRIKFESAKEIRKLILLKLIAFVNVLKFRKPINNKYFQNKYLSKKEKESFKKSVISIFLQSLEDTDEFVASTACFGIIETLGSESSSGFFFENLNNINHLGRANIAKTLYAIDKEAILLRYGQIDNFRPLAQKLAKDSNERVKVLGEALCNRIIHKLPAIERRRFDQFGKPYVK